MRCLLRAGVGGQAFTPEPESDVGPPVRLGPARPAISDGGPPRCVSPGSTFSFLKAVSVELFSTAGEEKGKQKAIGQLWVYNRTLRSGRTGSRAHCHRRSGCVCRQWQTVPGDLPWHLPPVETSVECTCAAECLIGDRPLEHPCVS